MGKKIQYSPGQIMNEKTGVILLEELEKQGTSRYGSFKCSCGEEFKARFHRVANEDKVCPKCSNKKREERQQEKYSTGDIINEQTGTIFLERTYKNSHGEWFAWFVCGGCGRKYETRISHAKSGCYCKKCRETKIKQSKTKYVPGDIVKSNNDLYFLFLEEVEPQRSISRTSRCGIFVRVDKDGNKIGEEFYSQLGHVISGNCAGDHNSNGEVYFENALKELSIDYNREYIFKDLLSDKGAYLRFDFEIPYKDKKLLIELDGDQHEKPVEVFGGVEAFERRKKHDELKNKYVFEHANLYLKRISQKEYKNINKEYVKNILNEMIKEIEGKVV